MKSYEHAAKFTRRAWIARALGGAAGVGAGGTIANQTADIGRSTEQEAYKKACDAQQLRQEKEHLKAVHQAGTKTRTQHGAMFGAGLGVTGSRLIAESNLSHAEQATDPDLHVLPKQQLIEVDAEDRRGFVRRLVEHAALWSCLTPLVAQAATPLKQSAKASDSKQISNRIIQQHKKRREISSQGAGIGALATTLIRHKAASDNVRELKKKALALKLLSEGMSLDHVASENMYLEDFLPESYRVSGTKLGIRFENQSEPNIVCYQALADPHSPGLKPWSGPGFYYKDTDHRVSIDGGDWFELTKVEDQRSSGS